ATAGASANRAATAAAPAPPIPAPRKSRPAPPRPIPIAGGGDAPLPPLSSGISPSPSSSLKMSNPFLMPATASTTMSGWIHKVETRPLLGVITRKRYWFALSEGSPYLYCSHSEEHVFETGCNTLREEWMKALQETRKRSWNTHIDIEKDIHSLTSLAASPRSPFESHFLESGGEQREKMSNLVKKKVFQTAPFSASVDELLKELGPTTSREEDEDEDGEVDGNYDSDENDVTVISDGRGGKRPMSPPISIPSSPSSKFYVAPDGSLNENSFEMPKEIVGPETMLSRLAENGIERPTRRAKEMATRGLREIRERGRNFTGAKDCEACKKAHSMLNDSDGARLEMEELVEAYEEQSKTQRKLLRRATKENEMLKRIAKVTDKEQEEVDLMLEKEEELNEARMRVNELQRRLQDAEEHNRRLETTVGGLQSDVEAFRDSVRTKEELIMRLAEQSEELEREGGERRLSLLGDVEVPEGIPLEDSSCIVVEEEARKIYEEQSVRDVHEMRDLVEGYRMQNEALNNEIIELHNMLTSYDEKERKLTRAHFETQACYYQLKSRYIMVLNHFKSPEKPGKIMEPGVLRELIDEANRTPRSARKDKNAKATDKLGFYVEEEQKTNGGNTRCDMFETAADCQKKADELMEASQLEQSEEYMKWLQAWDAFLVNSVNAKNALVSSPELKSLVRTGIPLAHRARVWVRLVSLHVRDRQAEMGNGYYECMLKKAKRKKEEGVFDAAIKQIDLDLARTLPTNKYFEDPSSEKVELLRRVLYAFRYHNTEVGYCQGLNRLAAIGLLYLTEEDAFWFLTSCVEILQPVGYYTTTLIGAVADQRVDLSLFTLSWFLTCFVDILPHSVYLNIFDVFLYEGNKILFRFALALLKLGESRVLQCKTIGTVHACLSRASDFVPNFKKLAQVAFNDLNPFPQKTIEQKRQMYLTELKGQGYR
ncbi:hypothetical protein PFISCL1PPCAC_6970, partial [Pristionchus fissidentatus]